MTEGADVPNPSDDYGDVVSFARPGGYIPTARTVTAGPVHPSVAIVVPDADVLSDVEAALDARPHRQQLAQLAFDRPRRFLLNRLEDPDGATGVGAVAWGTLYPSGRCSLDWNTPDSMKGGVYDSVEQVMRLHGHGGLTVIEWLDVA